MEKIVIQEKNQEFFLAKIQKQLLGILAILFTITLVINLWLLTDLGTRGGQLSDIRAREEDQKIQNDLLRSEFEALKVSSQIEKKAREQLKLGEKEVTVIDLDIVGVSAQK